MAGVKDEVDRPHAQRPGCLVKTREHDPATLSRRPQYPVIQEAGAVVRATAELDQQRCVSRQVELVNEDIRRLRQAGQQFLRESAGLRSGWHVGSRQWFTGFGKPWVPRS
ncbi:hypothetical protein HNQ60_003468 [Povalibacter uvarum]|uniref:Uncharacterized protein n=1 Tax=Povalibacter uvarum TaxID=732238 RepID=A0A841HMT8_9GAMM|nr:hypothetical protein [Povalibacter uvarum]